VSSISAICRARTSEQTINRVGKGWLEADRWTDVLTATSERRRSDEGRKILPSNIPQTSTPKKPFLVSNCYIKFFFVQRAFVAVKLSLFFL